MYEEILYSVQDPAAVITLHRPKVLNAWTLRMAAEVRHAVDQAEADPAVVAIVITGAGRGFCSGADMNLLTSLTGGDAVELSLDDVAFERAEPLPEDFDGEYTYLMATKKPVIAAINGAIAGMAVPIALCCDIRFMAEDAPLLTAFSQRGLVAEWGISWLLPRVIGTGRAMDLLLSSRRITGAEAAEMGLVNAAMPADEVLPHALKYVDDLAAKCSPESLAIMKRQVHGQMAGAARLGTSEKEAHKLMLASFGRPDSKEGVASFLEKRPPSFRRLGGRVPER